MQLKHIIRYNNKQLVYKIIIIYCLIFTDINSKQKYGKVIYIKQCQHYENAIENSQTHKYIP